ncbi:hypothetical protein MLD38_019066 [Melastoma candidum]|uniref:Uncharacterized protein n=1 Tax=Melastoma candidum TaxID=119954 RepID=A0ACB9QV81_9MYRT|nr:hypothetical protein MLD38_019066 [Melastoma candidum]
MSRFFARSRPSFRQLEAQNPSSLTADARIVHSLIDVFTGNPFSPDDPRLRGLSLVLTPKVVESVLNGLRSWKVAHRFFSWASNQTGYWHNAYTYNAMASILSRARQNDPMRRLLRDVVDSRCNMSPGALGFLIRCLGNLGMVEDANLMFDEVRKMGLCVPNGYTYNCLLEVIAKSSDADIAEMRLKEMQDMGWGKDKHTLTSMLQVYCNSGKLDATLRVFTEMYEKGWADVYVYSILVVSFSKLGEVNKAFELVERMEGSNMRLNEKTFYVLIHGFARANRVDKALKLFDKMLESGFMPGISLYDVLIERLCKNREFGKAFDLYAGIKDHGLRPDVDLLKKLTSYFSDESELALLLRGMPGDVSRASKTLLYNSFISFYINSGSPEKAWELLRAMTGDGCVDNPVMAEFLNSEDGCFADATSFTLVINNLVESGKLDSALSLFREMRKMGCEGSTFLYNNLINGLCDSNRLDEALEIVNEMKNSGLELTQFTYNCVYGYMCRRRDVPGALSLLKEMRHNGHEPWIKHSTSLVKQLSENHRVVEACQFLNDMVKEGFLPDIVAYSAALNGLIKIQKLDQAVELFRDLCARGRQPDVVAYNILISGLSKAGRVSEANEIVNEMVVSGLVPSVVTYNLLIDGWCKIGEVDNALQCLSRMCEEERNPNVISYTSVINGLCNVGRPDDALKLWDEMVAEGCEPNKITFMAMIHGLCKCVRTKEAIRFFRSMQDKEMKADAFIYVALLTSLVLDENFSGALELLKELIEAGSFPCSDEKVNSRMMDVVTKLSEESHTSDDVRELISRGLIPAIDPVVKGE